MQLLFQLAIRFLAPSRTSRAFHFTALVAVGSIFLGSMALILALSVLSGFEQTLRNTAVRFSAHITVSKFGRQPIFEAAAFAQEVQSILPTAKIAPVINKEILVSFRGQTDGGVVKSLSAESDITGIGEALVSGTLLFSSDDAFELVIGSAAAQKYGCGVGDTLLLYALQGDLNTSAVPLVEKCVVIGTFSTGLGKYDATFCFVPPATASLFAGLPPDAVSAFDIIVPRIADIEQASETLSTSLRYPYFPTTVFELYGSMFAWIDLQKEPIPIVLGLISIVAIFNVVTALLLLIVEKTKAIGLLTALGLSAGKVVLLFLFQGGIIGILGVVPGCLMGFLLCYAQYRFGIIRLDSSIYFLDKVPVAFDIEHYAFVVAVSLLLSLIATLIPARIAAAFSPLKALQFR